MECQPHGDRNCNYFREKQGHKNAKLRNFTLDAAMSTYKKQLPLHTFRQHIPLPLSNFLSQSWKKEQVESLFVTYSGCTGLISRSEHLLCLKSFIVISRSSSKRIQIENFNPLNPELSPICYLLALLGVHHFLHVSRIRVKSLTFRLLMSYIYGAPILDVSRSHTTTQHSR